MQVFFQIGRPSCHPTDSIKAKNGTSASTYQTGQKYIDAISTVLAPSSGKGSVMVWCPSVCPVGILTMIHQGAAYDVAVYISA